MLRFVSRRRFAAFTFLEAFLSKIYVCFTYKFVIFGAYSFFIMYELYNIDFNRNCPKRLTRRRRRRRR